MAGKPGKKPQAPQKPFDDDVEENEGFEDDVPQLNTKGEPIPASRSRDWRDVEKYRELRELKKLVGDDLQGLLDDLPEGEARPRGR
jgi:hypothetical protein